jgi:hypothetical protein
MMPFYKYVIHGPLVDIFQVVEKFEASVESWRHLKKGDQRRSGKRGAKEPAFPNTESFLVTVWVSEGDEAVCTAELKRVVDACTL